MENNIFKVVPDIQFSFAKFSNGFCGLFFQ